MSFHDEELCGVRTIWQKPSQCEEGGTAPKALLFLAHGMCHGAEDFFGEAGFAGLPEEKRIVAAALSSGFVVVACSSMNRSRKAWRPDDDGPRIAMILHALMEREGFACEGRELPICVLGASNGGAFALRLPQWLHVRAIVCQIMSGSIEHMQAQPKMPPVLFVHMPRDERTARGVSSCIEYLQSVGVRAEELLCPPLPIHDAFFKQRCGFDEIASKTLVEALRAGDFLMQDSKLADDPRQTEWREVLAPFAADLGDTLVADRSAIAEVLNVAWARHEITSEGVELMLRFCEDAIQ